MNVPMVSSLRPSRAALDHNEASQLTPTRTQREPHRDTDRSAFGPASGLTLTAEDPPGMAELAPSSHACLLPALRATRVHSACGLPEQGSDLCLDRPSADSPKSGRHRTHSQSEDGCEGPARMYFRGLDDRVLRLGDRFGKCGRAFELRPDLCSGKPRPRCGRRLIPNCRSLRAESKKNGGTIDQVDRAGARVFDHRRMFRSCEVVSVHRRCLGARCWTRTPVRMPRHLR